MKIKRKDLRTKRLFSGAAFATMLMIATAWLTFDFLFSPLERAGETVTVSDYVGTSVAEHTYEEWLTVKTEYKNHDTAPAGTVIAQSPSAHSRRKLSARNETVTLTLTVSLGKAYARLPNVVGMTAGDAEGLLRASGFRVRMEKKESAYTQGIVYEMSPSSGEDLPCGETVTLTVSAGTPEKIVKVPDLHGLTRAQAITELWLSGLAVENVVEEESDLPAGTVIRQSHQAGTLVRASTAVTVYVSKENTLDTSG